MLDYGSKEGTAKGWETRKVAYTCRYSMHQKLMNLLLYYSHSTKLLQCYYCSVITAVHSSMVCPQGKSAAGFLQDHKWLARKVTICTSKFLARIAQDLQKSCQICKYCASYLQAGLAYLQAILAKSCKTCRNLARKGIVSCKKTCNFSLEQHGSTLTTISITQPNTCSLTKPVLSPIFKRRETTVLKIQCVITHQWLELHLPNFHTFYTTL